MRITLSLPGVLLMLSMAGILVGSAISAPILVAASHPFPVSTYAASTTTVQPGVTFVLPAGYSNVTFYPSLVSTSSIQLPGYGKALIIDGVNISLVKAPASYPTAAINMTTWNPTQTGIGLPLVIMRVTQTGMTSLWVNFTGLTANLFVIPLFDGLTGGGLYANGLGAVKFVFQTWVGSVHTLEFDAGNIQSSPGSPGGGGIIASFTYGPHLTPIDSFSDNVMYFADNSFLPSGFAPVVIAWNFGDGSYGNGSPVKHVYNFSLAANFNVTMFICSQNAGTGGCASVTKSILLLAWHPLAIGIFIAGMGIASSLIIIRYMRTGKTGLEKVRTVVAPKYRNR
jgi:hypothetical protein